MGDRRGAYRVLVGRPEGRIPLGRPRILLKLIFKKWHREILTGLIWLRIGTGGSRFRIRRLTFGFHKMRGIS